MSAWWITILKIASPYNPYLIGDSILGSIMYDLKDKVVKRDYQLITSVLGACGYYPGFNMIISKTGETDIYCTDEYFQRLKDILSKERNSIMIFVIIN